ncbi:unnamed protein product [Cuscuta epithymum]|uniref:FBD domain-containing protein n=1 Tax=Cuscuta epithymum TaxID=186058 RepID=A0AAV0DB02_9ASTE|nr:unnamed protein product [Cuscuta epithymum]
MLRAGPVKKFTLDASCLYPKPPLQSDVDRWCLFLSRNGVEELHLSMPHVQPKYKLPPSLVSCKTIKLLALKDFVVHLPATAQCIFPGITALDLDDVEFRGNFNGLDSNNLPKLEKLAFLNDCVGVGNFMVRAPRLKSLTAFGSLSGVTLGLLRLHLTSINTLCLSADSFSDVVAVASEILPIATNLREMKFHHFSFGCQNHLTFLITLLKKSPELRVLEINVEERSLIKWILSGGGKDADSSILEGPREGGRFIKDDMRMVETVKINGFTGSEIELSFLKLVLSKSNVLQNVVICEAKDINDSLAFEAPKKLLSYPRASPKAQLVYKEYK